MENARSGDVTIEIIRHALHHSKKELPKVVLRADRGTLAKRRWRGTAEDGREFGFDLESHLHDGDVFFEAESAYQIEQLPEPVFEVKLDGHAPRRAAEMGWLFGNLHFPIQITRDLIRVADDPAVRQMLEREKIPFTETIHVFHPFKTGGHHHGH